MYYYATTTVGVLLILTNHWWDETQLDSCYPVFLVLNLYTSNHRTRLVWGIFGLLYIEESVDYSQGGNWETLSVKIENIEDKHAPHASMILRLVLQTQGVYYKHTPVIMYCSLVYTHILLMESNYQVVDDVHKVNTYNYTTITTINN